MIPAMPVAKGKRGKGRSVVFTPEQEARKEALLAATGMNFNAFVRLCVTKLTPDDIRQLQER